MRRSLLLLSTLFAGCSGELAPENGEGAPAGAVWFRDVAASRGLDFVHETGAEGRLWMPEIMGAGAALFDYDGDGDLDVYLANGAAGLGASSGGDAPTNRLFAQQEDGSFTDVTEITGLGDTGYGMGLAVGDIDNDGNADVYVTNHGPDRLYRNRGDGTFEDVTRAAGIDVDGWSTSASFCDYDGDGLLDLYVARYVDYNPARPCTDAAGRPEYCHPKEFPSLADVLLHNEGNATFADVSERAGVVATRGAGLGVVCADLDLDGHPDFYVANDLDANQLWHNQGDGTFHDAATLLGAAFNLEGMAESGMGVLAEDLDGDTALDLFVTHLEGQTNTLYRNLGTMMGFQDQTAAAGLAQASLRHTGFGVAALDADLDGKLDLVVANGRVFGRKPWMPGSVDPPWDRYAEPNLFFRGVEGGFEAFDARGFTVPVEISRGLATGDVDADGDIDLLVAGVQSPVRLYLNEAPRAGDWLAVRAVDPRLGRDAIGALVALESTRGRRVRPLTRGFGYLSSSEPRAHFGLAAGDAPRQWVVRWPDGLVESFDAAGTNREVTLRRGEGRSAP